MCVTGERTRQRLDSESSAAVLPDRRPENGGAVRSERLSVTHDAHLTREDPGLVQRSQRGGVFFEKLLFVEGPVEAGWTSDLPLALAGFHSRR